MSHGIYTHTRAHIRKHVHIQAWRQACIHAYITMHIYIYISHTDTKYIHTHAHTNFLAKYIALKQVCGLFV